MATQAARVAAQLAGFRAATARPVRAATAAYCSRCLARFTPTTSAPVVCGAYAVRPLAPPPPPVEFEPYWRTSDRRPLTDYGGLLRGSSLSGEFPVRTKL